ncbi:MAG TPA: DUF1223 domain-containing protein [Acidobacteriota bacterium]|nr:DUF1223 domain-containing protein [Acidobacteriota bacterium]
MDQRRRWIFLSLTVAAVVAWALSQQMAARSSQVEPVETVPLESAHQGGAPVVVELFTSEGCSSCPPADRLLAELAEQPLEGIEIIPLSLHVDYWDRLGWKDPFSSPRFSERQRRYGELLSLRNVYTPQMVVDGRREFVGSDRTRALREIKAAAHRGNPEIDVEVLERGPQTTALSIRLDQMPRDYKSPLKLMLAVTENGLSSNVARGENSGRHLRHDAVVRLLQSKVRIPEDKQDALDYRTSVQIESDWERSQLRIVAFLQDGQGAIHAAGSTALQ